MQSLSISEAKVRFSEAVRLSRKGPVEIRRHGRRAAMLISPEDFATLERLREVVNASCVVAGVERATALFASGEERRGMGLFRALVPYFRRAGVRDPRRPRTSPRRSLSR